MRELHTSEIDRVAGGFEGTKIPFSNGFFSGESMKGRPAGALGAAAMGWSIGNAIGAGINQFNLEVSGMSLGVAIHRTFNGGSQIVTGNGSSNGTFNNFAKEAES